MRLLKYSRPMVLISMGFACVAINFWLITTGHYRLPLFVFLGCIFITPLILRKLPPITTDPKEIATYQLKASSSARRLAFMYSAGFAMALLSLISGPFHELFEYAANRRGHKHGNSQAVTCGGGWMTAAAALPGPQTESSSPPDQSCPRALAPDLPGCKPCACAAR